MTLFTETGARIVTPGAALTITTAGTLRSLGFPVRHCNHLNRSYRIFWSNFLVEFSGVDQDL
jgi:hypothetical protein